MLTNVQWLAKAALISVVRPKMDRQKSNVMIEYSSGWESYAGHLGKAATLEDWLRIKGLEDVPYFCNVSGSIEYQAFDSNEYNRRKILETIKREFPEARSVTEYGCGLGRNLLYLKRHMPQLECYGYELCKPGVAIAQAAAEKFALDVRYSQLDYVLGAQSDYVFPQTDVAFTMYSLEQLPLSNRVAVENILKHTRLGSLHIEPVPENYPHTFRGIVGRLDHWKADYLKGFEKTVAGLQLGGVEREFLDSSHNPMMFPTLYVLRKN